MLVLAGLCLSFLLGTWLNLLPEPGLEPRPAGGSSTSTEDTRRGGEPGDSRLHVGGSPEPRGFGGGSRGTRTSRDPAGSLHELQLQIRERYDEVSRYRHLLRALPGRPLERRRLMDLEPPGDGRDPVSGQVHRNPAAPTGSRTETGTGSGGSPRLGCGSVAGVTDVQYLGSGYTKAVHRAALNRSLSVALKSVDLAGHDMETCGQRYRDTGACYRLASLKIIKEMVLMETLQHPNVLKVDSNIDKYTKIYRNIRNIQTILSKHSCSPCVMLC